MVEHSLNQLLEIINRQSQLQQELKEHLSKAIALAHISLDNDFLTHPSAITYYYLWALDDFIEKARDLNEEALSLLQAVLPIPNIPENNKKPLE